MNDQNPTLAWRSAPSGDSCLMLEFATVLSLQANRNAAAAAAILNEAWGQGELQGVMDIVPGMVTVGLHYWPHRVLMGHDDPSPYAALDRQVAVLLQRRRPTDTATARLIEIPVCYGGEYGPDLELVADTCGVSAQELVEIHTGQLLDILMLGFAPGLAHIGILDKRLSPPRLSTPRTLVKQGSVGLANRQSVVYPVDSPGGWSLIGRTPLKMFNAQHVPPCLLNMGDKVQFVAIDAAAFEAIHAQEHP